ncbi:MAG: hypothetical protein EZS28_025629, partial [Streblomastix strix]
MGNPSGDLNINYVLREKNSSDQQQRESCGRVIVELCANFVLLPEDEDTELLNPLQRIVQIKHNRSRERKKNKRGREHKKGPPMKSIAVNSRQSSSYMRINKHPSQLV